MAFPADFAESNGAVTVVTLPRFGHAAPLLLAERERAGAVSASGGRRSQPGKSFCAQAFHAGPLLPNMPGPDNGTAHGISVGSAVSMRSVHGSTGKADRKMLNAPGHAGLCFASDFGHAYTVDSDR